MKSLTSHEMRSLFFGLKGEQFWVLKLYIVAMKQLARRKLSCQPDMQSLRKISNFLLCTFKVGL